MPKTRQSQLEAGARYDATRDKFFLKPDKETGAVIRSAAAAEGKSLQRFILDIVMAYIESKSAYDN